MNKMCLGALAIALTPGVFGAKDVTFSKDVAPILYQHCVQCHRPGDIAPMALRTFDEVRPWVKSIEKMVIQDRLMPPWHADAPRGFFANDRRLTEEQIATIRAWIEQGTKRGAAKDLPPMPDFSGEWRLGKPDLVLELEEVAIPADGSDQFRDLVAVPPIDEDKWVRAIEFLPSDRRVVHHVIALTPAAAKAAQTQAGLAGWLGAWAAGTDPMVFPEGAARKIKQGEPIIFNMHYHPFGEATTDKLKVGLHFAKEKGPRELINHWVMDASFVIPAGAPNHEVRAAYVFDQEATIINVIPHMHYRGKDMLIKLVLPDGAEKVLCHTPKYDFNWQTVYTLAEPVTVPKGTRVEVLAHFDNSPNNPANPDPTKDVTFGPQSYDEMMIGMIDYVLADQPASQTD